ncbi:MAG: GMC family oxidoreductase N-terminal domain-containing protein [Hyphomonadaceae bacterium]|nr:GMC family oxidoreductase N-terminal domain-containing protein [Hyphomonadaceae bacterium]MBY0565132.1 GMC family oxidoreductase N-terminal domain-containing protein [Hyphomonadaceae bacterium]
MITHFSELPADFDCSQHPIVVGSGPVGLVIARRFSELGRRVVVFEAGEAQPTPTGRDCLNVIFSERRLPGTSIGRARQLGGGLNLWGGQLARPHRTEFADILPFANGDWLERYFLTAERLLGQEKSVSSSPREIDRLATTLTHHELDLVPTSWIRTPKWPHRIWDALQRDQNVIIVLGATISGLALDAARRRVTAVNISSTDGRRRRFAASSVIIAAGTIESVRILLQPGDEGLTQPWQDLPWLGRGFCEHLDSAVATVGVKRQPLINDLFDPVYDHGVKRTYKLFGSTTLQDGQKLSGVLMLSLPGNIRNALAETRMLIRSLTPSAALAKSPAVVRALTNSAIQIGPLAWRYLRHKRLGTILNGSATIRASIEQPVRWPNRIRLVDDFDPSGLRRVQLDWRTGEEEGHVFLSLAKRICGWLNERGSGEAHLETALVSDATAFAAQADDGLHHSGGAKMGAHASNSVVSHELEVHTTRGLYVCGAAVFPRPGYANPTLTAAALGVRLAEHLATTRSTS